MKLKRNLDELVYEKLMESVLAAQWHSGDVISIEAIAEKYEVSRTPVVQALKRLTSEGITEFLANGKARFPLTDEKIVGEVCDVRAFIEIEAGRIICENRYDVANDDLYTCMEKCILHRGREEYHLASQMDLQWHRMIVEGAGNSYLADLYKLVQKKFVVLNYLNLPAHMVLTDEAASQHRAIFDALKRFDYPQFRVLIRAHLQNAKEGILSMCTT